jgi:hypothetical protein
MKIPWYDLFLYRVELQSGGMVKLKRGATVLFVLTMVTTIAVAESPSAEELTALLRESLETQFQISTGLGFSRFHCDIPAGLQQPPRELTCQATDEEGDRFYYRLTSAEDRQPPSVSTSQPVSQLNPSGLAVLERPCLEFLSAFERLDWSSAYSSLSPELQTAISRNDFEASLVPVRRMLGELRNTEAKNYSSPSPGLHSIEYELASEGGDAVARFRLKFSDDEKAQIMAFLVTSRPGSELQAKLLSAVGRQVLSNVLGQQVKEIKAPLADLELIGDVVEGTAKLDGGDEAMIRVEQHQTAHDLDGNDYRFQVLEVSWLIRTHLVSTGQAPSRIDCPARKAPDGGEVECTVTLEDGSQRSITIARRGGEHRLVQ